MKKLPILIFALLIYSNITIAQQNTKPLDEVPEAYITAFGEIFKDTTILKIFIGNAPKYTNAPDMPRFAIIGKDREFYLGIGGYVKGSLSYDLGNPIESPLFFEPSSIPMDNPAGNNALVQLSGAASNIFINFVGLPHTKNQIGAYIDFNFTGNAGTNYSFSLAAAYLTYKNFLVGYNTSLFTDGAATAPSIDQQGPNALTFAYNTVLDYIYKINKNWSFGVGLEMPLLNATYNNYTYAVNQYIPDIPAYLQYSWAKGNGWIRLSGIYRSFAYRDQIDKKNNSNAAGGVKLSGALPFLEKFKLFYQGVYGSGISSYVQDMQGLGLDLVPVASAKLSANVPESELGDLGNVKNFAGYLGLQYNICPKLLASATYSFVRSYLPPVEQNTIVQGQTIKEDNSYMPGTTYKNAQYIVTNIFYDITPNVTAGVEYLWGSRRDVNDIFKQNNRLQTAIVVNF